MRAASSYANMRCLLDHSARVWHGTCDWCRQWSCGGAQGPHLGLGIRGAAPLQLPSGAVARYPSDLSRSPPAHSINPYPQLGSRPPNHPKECIEGVVTRAGCWLLAGAVGTNTARGWCVPASLAHTMCADTVKAWRSFHGGPPQHLPVHQPAAATSHAEDKARRFELQ